jgi:hypothetical protein
MDGAKIPLPGMIRSAATRTSALRSAAIFIAGALLIVGGLIGLDLLLGSGEIDTSQPPKGPHPAALFGLGLVLMTVEAALFTLLPIELSRRFLKRAWPGVAAGFASYVIAIHWDNGWLGLVVSTWIWSIVTGAYLLERPISWGRAACQAVGLKWVFWIFAMAGLTAGA